MSEGKVVVEERAYHYFGTTPFDWATGNSVEEVIVKLAKRGTVLQRTQYKKGLYCWTCKVLAPESTHYGVSNYMPVGVEIEKSQEWNIFNTNGHCLPITKD